MKPRSLKCILAHGIAALAISLAGGSAVAADDFPNKPVRIIIPAAAGGSLDITTRLIAQKMTEKLGQQVIVENRPGADTLLGTRVAKDAPADGYTILGQANSFSLLPHIRLDPGYDPLKDFVGLGIMTTAPYVMAVGADQPDRTVKEFVARGKTTTLSNASGGTATPQHVAALMFFQMAGLKDVTMVQYKGAGAALPDVVAGRVSVIFDGYISSKSFISTGKLIPLAVTSPTRIAPLPNVPTFVESGYDFTFKFWLGLLVRTGTPKDAVQRLSEALQYALSNKELAERFRSEGADPSYVSPEDFNALLRKEYSDMGKLATDLKFEKQ